MTGEQIRGLGPELREFLGEFGDSFGRVEQRRKLEIYVGGQLSELPRKSIEPIALEAGIAPRNLQEFLASDDWEEDRLRGHTVRLVVRDHSDPEAIGVIDESGHPKKGDETAGVSPQYCGNTGKIDNCVTTVHLTYSSFDSEFRTMLESDLYLPRCWDEDRERCRRAKIPDEIVYRPKYDIALEQLDRARGAGVSFAWITADEWYTEKPKFLRGLENRGLRYVLEAPRNLSAWLFDPALRPDVSSKPLENLLRYSAGLMRQPWAKYRIKDTDKGPLVWEVKCVPCWLPCGSGAIGPYWLIVARNVLHPDELKYFISNAGAGVPLTVLLHVAFGRWPVERCLQDEKSELGLSHFEVRGYPALKRHLLITQVSHLFLARQTARLRGEKSGDHAPSSPHGRQCIDRVAPTPRSDTARCPRTCGAKNKIPPRAQCDGSAQPHQDPASSIPTNRSPAFTSAALCSRTNS
jgi:SRSO17 transposase